MSNEENGVFETLYEDDETGKQRKGFFWRFGDIEKDGFFSVRECAKDFCACLTDLMPEMKELFNGETWQKIYLAAGISKEIRSQLTVDL